MTNCKIKNSSKTKTDFCIAETFIQEQFGTRLDNMNVSFFADILASLKIS